MNSSLCWDEIKSPKVDLTVRKVPRPCFSPVFIGKNVNGQYLLLIGLTGEHSFFFKENKFTVNGLEIDLRQQNELQNLVITLETSTDKDIFTALCNSLVDAIRNITDSNVVLAVALTHLKRWKFFMAGRGSEILTIEAVRGLFAELHYLEKLLVIAQLNCYQEILAAWLGPNKQHQDFIFSNTAIEVKALSGKERHSVRISSEDQLDGLVDHLYLKIFRLGCQQSSENAKSLNEQVDSIEKILANTVVKQLFYEKLAAAGYLPLTEYDTPRFSILSETTYHVTNGFPCITKGNVPDGVANVGYDLMLSKIDMYTCSNEIDWNL